MKKRTSEQIELLKKEAIELINNNENITVKEIAEKVNLSLYIIYAMPEVKKLITNKKNNLIYQEIVSRGYSIELFHYKNFKFSVYLIKDNKRIAKFELGYNGKTKDEMIEYLKVAKTHTNAHKLLIDIEGFINNNK